MASDEAWERLEKCTTLRAASEDATVVFALGDNVMAKQKKLKTIVKVYELAQALFQGVHMEIGSDTDSDDTNGGNADEHAARHINKHAPTEISMSVAT